MLKKPENGTQSISRWKGPGVKRWRFLRSRGRLECAKFHSFVWVSGWSFLCSPLPYFHNTFFNFQTFFRDRLNSKPCQKTLKAIFEIEWATKKLNFVNEKVWKVPWGSSKLRTRVIQMSHSCKTLCSQWKHHVELRKDITEQKYQCRTFFCTSPMDWLPSLNSLLDCL